MRNGLSLIKSFEGCKLKSYPDPATGGKPWTIGYGRTTNVKPGDTCTQDQADDWVEAEYDGFEAGVVKLLGRAPTNANQLGALVSFAYNLGLGNLASSTLLKKHIKGDYVGAKAEFQRWNKAAGKVMAGLTRRRLAEAALYATKIVIAPKAK
jgi:lysozyme